MPVRLLALRAAIRSPAGRRPRPDAGLKPSDSATRGRKNKKLLPGDTRQGHGALRHDRRRHGQTAAVETGGQLQRLVQAGHDMQAGGGEEGRIHVRHEDDVMAFRGFGQQKAHIPPDGERLPQGGFACVVIRIGGELAFRLGNGWSRNNRLARHEKYVFRGAEEHL